MADQRTTAQRKKRASDTEATSSILIQRTVAHEVPDIVHEILNTEGQPLEDETRAFMEPHFGHDFSQVRIHTDERAAESAQAMNALAYTVGRDVVFAPGQYMPETTEGKRLLAHELTHSIQQAQWQTEAAPTAEAIHVNEPGDMYEQEANRVADVVSAPTTPGAIGGINGQAHGFMRDLQRSAGKAPMLQRQTPEAAPTKSFNPLDPQVLSQAAGQVIAEEQTPVRQWLDSNTVRLSIVPKDQVVIQVKQNVPQAAKLADAEIQLLVDEWARRNHVALPDGQSDQSKIGTVALGALSMANEGVIVTRSPFETKVAITGITATLKTGDVDFEASLGINREIELAVSYGNFKFSTKLSSGKWSLTLSYGTDDVPDLDGLAKTFSEGEKSLRRIAGDPASLSDPENASNAKEALDSLSNIVKSIPKRIEISAGSADSSGNIPGGGKQGGWQVMVKITVLRF